MNSCIIDMISIVGGDKYKNAYSEKVRSNAYATTLERTFALNEYIRKIYYFFNLP